MKSEYRTSNTHKYYRIMKRFTACKIRSTPRNTKRKRIVEICGRYLLSVSPSNIMQTFTHIVVKTILCLNKSINVLFPFFFGQNLSHIDTLCFLQLLKNAF